MEAQSDVVSESYASKWRDVKAYLTECGDLFPDLPGISEIGAQVLGALTCNREEDGADKPVTLANFNSASDSERQQDSLFQGLLEHMPGVRLEQKDSGNVCITHYTLALTSSIGRQVLRFTRSLVPSLEAKPGDEKPSRIIYSVASSTDQPLP